MASLRQQIATTALTLTKFRELMKRIQENRPQDDLSIVKKAYDYSLKNHEGQTRASGEPYLVHPLEVALVLAEMKMDPVAIAAGLLHDSVEDTSVTIGDIQKEFGEQVAHIVEGVTKISKIDFATREEAQAARKSGADAFLSANRTCEMGMRHASGQPYESFVFTLEYCTRS